MPFSINEKLSQGTALVGVVAPVSVTTASLTAAIDLQKSRKVLGICTGGVLGTAATVTFKAQGSATSGGSYTDITGTSVTLVKATDDGKSVILDITAEGVNNLGLGYRFIKFSVSADVASLVSVTAIGASGPEEPMAALNLATVKSITTI